MEIERAPDEQTRNGQPPEYSPYTWWLNAELSLDRAYRRRRRKRRNAMTLSVVTFVVPALIFAIYLIVH